MLGKIRAHPFFDVFGLADVNKALVCIKILVHPGLVW
jgi:hypothetical protein